MIGGWCHRGFPPPGNDECSLSFPPDAHVPIHWKKFVHPAGVYRLEYPAYWDQVQQDEARSCGFGPHDRDDVGLWISLMPVSVDSDRLADELPKILDQALPQSRGATSAAIRPCAIMASRPICTRKAKEAITG